MSRKIVDLVAMFFIACVGFMMVLAILSIWNFIDGDVVGKAMATIGIVAFASVVAVFASKATRSPSTVESLDDTSLVPLFGALRSFTSVVLVISVVILALVGVMAIWEVISDKSTLMKVISSMIVVAFSCVIIIFSCADREGRTIMGTEKSEESKPMSFGRVVLLVFLGLYFLSYFFRVF